RPCDHRCFERSLARGERSVQGSYYQRNGCERSNEGGKERSIKRIRKSCTKEKRRAIHKSYRGFTKASRYKEESRRYRKAHTSTLFRIARLCGSGHRNKSIIRITSAWFFSDGTYR